MNDTEGNAGGVEPAVSQWTDRTFEAKASPPQIVTSCEKRSGGPASEMRRTEKVIESRLLFSRFLWVMVVGLWTLFVSVSVLHSRTNFTKPAHSSGIL